MDKIREQRLDWYDTTIWYYEDLMKKGQKLSKMQREQLQEVADTVIVFGEYGEFLSSCAQNILASC